MRVNHQPHPPNFVVLELTCLVCRLVLASQWCPIRVQSLSVVGLRTTSITASPDPAAIRESREMTAREYRLEEVGQTQ